MVLTELQLRDVICLPFRAAAADDQQAHNHLWQRALCSLVSRTASRQHVKRKVHTALRLVVRDHAPG